MAEYPSNSHRYKEEQKKLESKKVEKVISGNARVKKKNELTKLRDTFISEDASKIKSYVLMDVIVPGIKNAIEDIVTNGIRMILRGETSARRNYTSGNVSYTSYYKRPSSNDRPSENRSRLTYTCNDIVLDTRGEAEAVLSRLGELIDTYGVASVADLYDLVGISREYTDNKYGWNSMRNAYVDRVRDGYMLRLPSATPID